MGSQGHEGDEEEGSHEAPCHEGSSTSSSSQGHEGHEEEGSHEAPRHEGSSARQGHEGHEEEGSHEAPCHEGCCTIAHEGHEGHEVSVASAQGVSCSWSAVASTILNVSSNSAQHG